MSPLAFVVVRLNEITPDGASTRISYGMKNLTHRNGPERPEALKLGERYKVSIKLNDIAHAFEAGNRIRVALSTTYWPMVWPSPEPVTLTVHTAGSLLDLPTRAPRPEDAKLAPFA